jgi:hypothetical protein
VAFEIGLAIAVEVEPPGENSPRYRAFPDRGADDFALPRNFTWKAHIDGQKFWHWLLQCKRRCFQEQRRKTERSTSGSAGAGREASYSSLALGFPNQHLLQVSFNPD